MPSRRAPQSREVFVGIEIEGEIVTAGLLLVDPNVTPDRDTSTGRFRYAPSYLQRPSAVALDPVHLPLEGGEFRFARFGGLPSCIRDAAPDNWGRQLIRRYYTSRGVEKPLSEVDYLLASPIDRVGTLHFASSIGANNTPDWNRQALKPEQIPDLAVLKDAVVQVLTNPQGAFAVSYPKELDALLTGTGGARPKVSLRSKSGLYLAKLSNPVADTAPNGRLEQASLRMARAVGILTADAVVRRAGDFEILAVKRFDIGAGDRTQNRLENRLENRLQMVSAMSVLDADEDPYRRLNWSYPLLARELDRWSADPVADKLMLFRCMVLRAMISDADDHPRNYALIRDPTDHRNATPGGNTLGQWRLSPMYDSVVGMGRGYLANDLAMQIGDRGREISESNILSQAAAFGLSRVQASTEMLAIESKVLAEFGMILADCGADEASIGMAMRSVAPLNNRTRESPVQALVRRFERLGPTNEAGSSDMPSVGADFDIGTLLEEDSSRPRAREA